MLRERSGVDRERREAATAVLVGLRDQGQLSRAKVRQVAQELGAGERTVWRWVSAVAAGHGKAGGHRRWFEVTPEDIAELAYWQGNVAAFHRALRERDPTAPSLPTVWRAVRRALTPGQLAGLAEGEEARREFDTYLVRAPSHRNQVWQADHCELAVEVLLPNGRVVKPWLTSFIDAFSRVVCGWAISEIPSQESVFAALRVAILTEPPHGPFGGVPAAIRWDRGKEFLAGAVTAAAKELAIDARPLPPYSPYLKGTVERLHESIEVMLLAHLPGFTHGPRKVGGRPIDETAPLLTLDHLVELFANFATEYNTVHPHGSLHGATPIDTWRADTTPLVAVPRDRLSYLLLARQTRVITKKGISIFGVQYNAAELVGLVGERVEVRYMPHRDESVEVFYRGAHLCTAWILDAIEHEEARRLLARRAEQARWLARQHHAASQKRRARFATMTEPRSSSISEAGEEPVTSRSLTPSRSLVDHSVIPAHMVRPLSQPISDGDSA